MEDSREPFLQTLEKMEKEMGFNEARMASIAGMMRSPRSAFASLLNEEAIVGHHFVSRMGTLRAGVPSEQWSAFPIFNHEKSEI